MNKEVDKNKLRQIYYEHEIIEAAKILGMSVPTMMKLIKSEKIPLKGRKRFTVK